jgi:hypothetical protein
LFDVAELDVSDLPEKASDIVVCDALRALIAKPFCVYVCKGKTLPAHRALIHDRLLEINQKESLHQVAIKQVVNFQPSAVLEGGNGFLDMPVMRIEPTASRELLLPLPCC